MSDSDWSTHEQVDGLEGGKAFGRSKGGREDAGIAPLIWPRGRRQRQRQRQHHCYLVVVVLISTTPQKVRPTTRHNATMPQLGYVRTKRISKIEKAFFFFHLENDVFWPTCFKTIMIIGFRLSLFKTENGLLCF